MSKNVGIIGAGASGLVAAIFAARSGAKVTILEKGPKACRKVLASGNGKCNLTNSVLKPEFFHSQNPDLAWALVRAFDNKEAQSFFKDLGLLTKEEAFGRVLPVTEQARNVAEVLLHEAQRLGVVLELNRGVAGLFREKAGFRLETYGRESLSFDNVVIACGGPSDAVLGGTYEGMHWAQNLGHFVAPVTPAIVGLALEGNWFHPLQGVRQDAGLIVENRQGEMIEQRFGEILFTKTGISGPVVFDAARAILAEIKRMNPAWEVGSKKPGAVNHNMKAPRVWLDLFKGFGGDAETLLRERWAKNPDKGLAFSFVGLFQDKTAPALLTAMGYSKADQEKPVSALSEFEIKNIAKALRRWEMKVNGCRPFNEAQAVSGGVSLGDVVPGTLESKKVPGLYFCGEVLDVVGDCGGYNLQWAWSSGYAVGSGIAKAG